MTTVAQRRDLGVLMDLLVAHEPSVHYKSVRPMLTRHLRTVAQLRAALASPAGIVCDCSETVTLLCRLASLADPNGVAYDGYGGTGTMLLHLPHYHVPSHAMTGALVVFGPGNGEHVCMVRTPGKDPLLFSHGSERGPLFIPLSQEARYHHAPVTFLAVGDL